MSRKLQLSIVAAAVVAAVALAVPVLRRSERYPTTSDAYVDANVVGIVPQVAGRIVELPIADNQPVSAGELLFQIDPRPFEIQVDQARAQLDRTGLDVTALTDQVASAEARVRYAEAALQLAEAQWARVEPLAKIGAVPYQDRDKALAALDGARAGLDSSQSQLAEARANLGDADANNPGIRAAVAQLGAAELELSYARVESPVNGLVTDLDVSAGSYASVGSPALTLIDTDSWRVVAYFKETQLERIRAGQAALVYLNAYPDMKVEGFVQGVGWAVEQQNGDGAPGPSGVPTVDPTVAWVVMAQRFPVRITIPDADRDRPLRKGMRATVRIDTTSTPGDR